MSPYFYVYFLPPSYQIPEWHYGYYSFDLEANQYPDNRLYQPIWVYYNEADEYTDISLFIEPQVGQLKKIIKKATKALTKLSFRKAVKPLKRASGCFAPMA